MSVVYLDHVVILLPYKDILHPPKWLTDNFKITPGGRHAGGQTENKLIIFQDGSYIELIAFIDDDPNHRAGHRWGDKSVGIIDFGFSSQEEAGNCYQKLKHELDKVGAAIKYKPPAPGGRRREDGQVIEWKVTAPDQTKRGELPFFCHDVTPRELRVPFSGQSTLHPSKACGITGLKIYVPQERVPDLAVVYSAILSTKKETADEGVAFEIDGLHHVDGKQRAVLSIQAPHEEWQRKLVAERGVLLDGLHIGVPSAADKSGNTEQIGFDFVIEGIQAKL